MTKIPEESYLRAKQLPEEQQDMVGRAILSLIDDEAKGTTLNKETPRPKRQAKAVSAKGLILYMADDFDAPLEDFKDYM